MIQSSSVSGSTCGERIQQYVRSLYSARPFATYLSKYDAFQCVQHSNWLQTRLNCHILMQKQRPRTNATSLSTATATATSTTTATMTVTVASTSTLALSVTMTTHDCDSRPQLRVLFNKYIRLNSAAATGYNSLRRWVIRILCAFTELSK